ncbi:MAG: hypothetical protein ACYTEQ_05255 [Planctomycetota bacterium]
MSKRTGWEWIVVLALPDVARSGLSRRKAEYRAGASRRIGVYRIDLSCREGMGRIWTGVSNWPEPTWIGRA